MRSMNLTIVHSPVGDVKALEKFYSEKDGVPCTYVLTTCNPQDKSRRMYDMYDIFYRETPHPVFGNKYFGISSSGYICNGDFVAGMPVSLIEANKKYFYGQAARTLKAAGVDTSNTIRTVVQDGGLYVLEQE